MVNGRSQNMLLVLLTIMLFIVYFFGLFIDITHDAAKYACISREITENNSWFFLTILDEPYIQKPPFMFWLSAISFRLFGISNFSFKLPLFIYSLLGFYAVYRLSKSMYGPKTAKLATLILATSAITVLYNMDIHTDTVLFTNIALSLWFLYEYLQRKKTGYLFAAGIALGLSVLTKGVFGLLVPGFAVLGYVASKQNWKKLIDAKWLILVLIIVVVSLPVLIPLYIRDGFDGIRFFIWDNNFGRVTGKYKGVINDPAFYLHTLMYMLLPWTVVFMAGFVTLFSPSKTNHANRFILWGFAGVFIILTLSKNKLPNYLMCLLPLTSVIAARGWETFFSKAEKTAWKTVHTVVLILLWLLMLAVPIALFPHTGLLFWFVMVLLAGMFFFTRYEKTTNTLSVIIPTVLTGVALAFLINMNLAQNLFSRQAAVKAAQTINNMETPAGVYYFNPDDIDYQKTLKNHAASEADSTMKKILLERHFFLNYELMFYCNQPVGYIESYNQVDALCREKNAIIYTNENGKMSLSERCNGQALTVMAFPDINPSYPASYLLQKTGHAPVKTMYLIELSNE